MYTTKRPLQSDHVLFCSLFSTFSMKMPITVLTDGQVHFTHLAGDGLKAIPQPNEKLEEHRRLCLVYSALKITTTQQNNQQQQ